MIVISSKITTEFSDTSGHYGRSPEGGFEFCKIRAQNERTKNVRRKANLFPRQITVCDKHVRVRQIYLD